MFATQGAPPVSTKPTVILHAVVSLPPSSTTPAVQLELRIFSRILEVKIEMTIIDLSGARGRLKKKTGSKKSRGFVPLNIRQSVEIKKKTI
jgi:hypothetical protein